MEEEGKGEGGEGRRGGRGKKEEGEDEDAMVTERTNGRIREEEEEEKRCNAYIEERWMNIEGGEAGGGCNYYKEERLRQGETVACRDGSEMNR